MKNYKLIISDYDGTLAGRGEHMSQDLIHAIKKWEESGGHFSIATGKSYLRIKDSIDLLGLTTPQITRGGAEIVDPKTGNVIFSKFMDKETVEDIIKFLLQNKYDIIVDTEDKYYSTNNYQSGNVYESHLTLDEFEMRPIPKIVIWIGDRDIKEAEAFLEDVLVKRYPQLSIAKSYSPLGKMWDVTSLEATKHLATLELMKLLNVIPQETVGVGDGYNDFPLLEACGFKVAMGNAPEELKAIADLVVPSYTEDGVVVLIEKLLEK